MIANYESLISKLAIMDPKAHGFCVKSAKKQGYAVTAEYDGKTFYIAGSYDPLKNGADYASANYAKNKNILLFGMGVGYAVAPFLELLQPGQTLHIFEANLALVQLAFSLGGAKQLMQNPQVQFYASDSLPEMAQWLSAALQLEDIHLVLYEPSIKAMPASMATLSDLLQNYRYQIKTQQKSAPMMLENKEKNNSYGYRNAGYLFKESFASFPVVTVAAGYSLRYSLDALRKLHEKAVIIAVGRASTVLDDAGVCADFYIETDCKSYGYQVSLSKIANQRVPLILLETAYHGLHAYQGEKLILFEKHSAVPDLKAFAVESGGSVATTAISFGVLTGAKMILLIGQDLCYVSDYTHADGAYKAPELVNKKMVAGINGHYYPTSYNLYSYLKWIERYISRNPSTTFFNLTHQGAAIDGAPHKDALRFIETLPDIREQIEDKKLSIL